MSESSRGTAEKIMNILIFSLSLFFVGFHIYTAVFGVMSGVGQKAMHIGIIMLIFYLRETIKPTRKAWMHVIDWLCVLMTIASITYLIIIDRTIDARTILVNKWDIVFGIMFLSMLLEATRRAVGKALAIVVGVFVIYFFTGKYLPGFLKFAGLSLKKFISVMYLSSDGVFGTALYSSAAFIVLFIILGAIFQETGIGQFFTDLATLGFGKYSGGPAKVSVVASGFFGSISGSTIANVISTGTFTIPLMKKSGFDENYAGAVEAAASTGGQIMPPVMGATAFLIAQILNISYFDLVKAAAIPAILYYVGVLLTVHLHAKKLGLKGVPKEEMPDKKNILMHLYLITPLILLLVLMGVFKYTVTRAGLWTIALTVLLVELDPKTRINWKRFKGIVRGTVNGMIPVAIACAVVGIITGVVMATGIAFRLSSILLDLAGGRMFLLLILTMIASLIMGMGLPTTAAYMVLEVLVAPALITMGVSAIAAHLFILYFGVISNITPPVALAAYAAAGLAKGAPAKTGVKAFQLAISGFIVPFMFIYNDVLLLKGSFLPILGGVATALIGVYCLSAAMERFFFRWKITIPEVVLMIAAAILLIDSQLLTDAIGVGIIVLVAVFHLLKNGTKKKAEVSI